jgi:hypothetical protein
MPKLKENQVSSYRLYKQSGQAIVTLNGRDVLLGSTTPKQVAMNTSPARCRA